MPTWSREVWFSRNLLDPRHFFSRSVSSRTRSSSRRTPFNLWRQPSAQSLYAQSCDNYLPPELWGLSLLTAVFQIQHNNISLSSCKYVQAMVNGGRKYLRQIFKCFILEVQLFIIIIFIINGGILSLTDSHHHHHGQNPTMVGICHGGNVLGSSSSSSPSVP